MRLLTGLFFNLISSESFVQVLSGGLKVTRMNLGADRTSRFLLNAKILNCSYYVIISVPV